MSDLDGPGYHPSLRLQGVSVRVCQKPSWMSGRSNGTMCALIDFWVKS